MELNNKTKKAWPLADADAKTRAMLVDGTQLPQTNRQRKPKRPLPGDGQAYAAVVPAQAKAAQLAQQAPARTQGHRQRKEAVASTSRLEQEVASSRVWLQECQALQPPLPEAVPSTFRDLQQYINTFEPLLHEEAAESIRSGFEEADRARRGVSVVVQLVSPLTSGWHVVRLAGARPDHVSSLRQLQQDRDASVVVLTLPSAASASASQGAAAAATGASNAAAKVTGFVRRWEVEQGVVYVHIRPCCDRHPAGPSSPCCKVLVDLQQQGKAGWQLVPAGSVVTSARECATLSRLHQVPLLDYILNPAGFAARFSSNDAEPRQAINPDCPDLPGEISSNGFWSYLHDHFDGPQIQAIKCSAAHLLLPKPKHRQQGTNEQQQGRLTPDASDVDMDSDGEGLGASSSERVPFTLIQGPPGTGKTHTVLGVLNTWHLVQFQRFFMSLDSAVRQLAESGAAIDKVLVSDDFPARLAPRPRILVCAPSNAAIDELLERILRGTFRDVNGQVYRPDVVRLGSEEALSDAVRQVWVEQMAGRLLAHAKDSFLAERAEQEHLWRQCLTRMHNVADSLAVAQQSLNQHKKAAGTAAAVGKITSIPPSSPQPRESTPGSEAASAVQAYTHQVAGLVAQLVNEFEQLQKLQANLSRLALVAELVAGSGSGEWGRKLAAIQAAKAQQHQQHHGHGPEQQQHRVSLPELWRAAYRAAPRDLQSDLEVSFVDQAEMVFTTLSSSARDVFGRLQRRFPRVLIDEAAQASEIAALQPLVYGAECVVMVGDPQQLPATIFSHAAKQLALERSLFERLALAGCPVNVLTVQYRMHPAIRSFPSAYFYQNKLVDAPSVLTRPKPFFAQDDAITTSGSGSSSVLIPYAVFDVSSGRERFARGKSAENEREANLAVALYGELRRLMEVAAAAAAKRNGPPPPRLEVGVITPYKSQRHLMRQLFVRQFGKGILQEVKIETVDSFQGKQLDVVILSCVRASSGSANSNRSANSEALAAVLNAAGAVANAAAGGVEHSARFMVQGRLAAESADAAAADGSAGSNGNAVSNSPSNAAADFCDSATGTPGQQQQQPPGQARRGVGFLSDTRRMNVAITRARLALYVLGHLDTLVNHPAWESLIVDAGRRQCIVWDATTEGLTQPDKRTVLAQQLQKALQLQEQLVAMLQQQQGLTANDVQGNLDAAAAGGDHALDDMAVDSSSSGDEGAAGEFNRRGSTPPLTVVEVLPPPATASSDGGGSRAGTPPSEHGSAAAAGEDWLQVLREKQAAELKRKHDETRAKQQERQLKRQRLMGELTAADLTEGSGRDSPAPGGIPPQPSAAAAAGSAAAGSAAAAASRQSESFSSSTNSIQQQVQLGWHPGRQINWPIDMDVVWLGEPGDGFDAYRGLTLRQGALLWLMAPLVQQTLLGVLRTIPQTDRVQVLQQLPVSEAAWLVPRLYRDGLLLVADAAALMQQRGLIPAVVGQELGQQAELPPPLLAAAVAAGGFAGQPGQPSMQQQQQPDNGGQMQLMPVLQQHVLQPVGYTPAQQQQQQPMLVSSQPMMMQLQPHGAASGQQLVLLPAHMAAVPAGDGSASPLPAGIPAAGGGGPGQAFIQQQQQQPGAPPGVVIVPHPPKQQQQQHMLQSVLEQGGVLVLAQQQQGAVGQTGLLVHGDLQQQQQHQSPSRTRTSKKERRRYNAQKRAEHEAAEAAATAGQAMRGMQLQQQQPPGYTPSHQQQLQQHQHHHIGDSRGLGQQQQQQHGRGQGGRGGRGRGHGQHGGKGADGRGRDGAGHQQQQHHKHKRGKQHGQGPRGNGRSGVDGGRGGRGAFRHQS